jgi:hypothetical protein
MPEQHESGRLEGILRVGHRFRSASLIWRGSVLMWLLWAG